MVEFWDKKGLSNLLDLLSGLDVNRIFLVTGDQSYELSGAKRIIDSIPPKYSLKRFFEFDENPNINDIKSGLRQLNKFKPDVIVAIGGGSVIDMAKALIAFTGIRKSLEFTIKNNIVSDKKLPFIVCPTTAGSGSEATSFAVVYIDDVKYSISHSNLLPNYAFFDISLLKSQSSYQKAVSGIDAFSQAIESLWSIHSTEESRFYSLEAISILWNNLPQLTRSSDDLYFENVMKGSHLAGKAINITKTTAPHAFAYGFTSHLGLPHGHAVALTLPFFVNYNCSVNYSNCCEKRGVDYVIARLCEISHILNTTVDKLAQTITGFIISCGISINFKELKITFDDFQRATNLVNADRLSNNPVQYFLGNKDEIYYSKFNCV